MGTTITVALIGHADKTLLLDAIERVKSQTVQPDQLLVMTSGMSIDSGWIATPDLKDFGYFKRALALGGAWGDWITWWNFDDVYHPQTLEKALSCTESADVVYWRMHGKKSATANFGFGFDGCKSSVGNWMVRTQSAREVGYAIFARDHLGGYPGDASMIDELNRRKVRVAHVAEYLMDQH